MASCFLYRRREFITLLSGAAAWPLAARAQQAAMPVIGYLSARSPDDTWHLMEAFRRGLYEAGFVEGQNATIEYRWALGEQERLAGLASDLVRKPVTVLVATGGESAALAAKAATSTIPIVFIIGGDPVKLGLAASYSRPGANATGISILTATLEPKRLELLHELVPQASTIGAFLDPNYPPIRANYAICGRRRALSTYRSTNWEPALTRKSTWLSKQSRSSGSARSWSPPDLFSIRDARSW
jgi:putative tryptophan/tyrosine transport system substrate-binding protein